MQRKRRSSTHEGNKGILFSGMRGYGVSIWDERLIVFGGAQSSAWDPERLLCHASRTCEQMQLSAMPGRVPSSHGNPGARFGECNTEGRAADWTCDASSTRTGSGGCAEYELWLAVRRSVSPILRRRQDEVDRAPAPTRQARRSNPLSPRAPHLGACNCNPCCRPPPPNTEYSHLQV